MPGDPFKPAHKGKAPKPKLSKPTAIPKGGVKAPSKGVSPGAKGGKASGVFRKPAARSTAHTGVKRSMPKVKTPARTGPARGRGRKK